MRYISFILFGFILFGKSYAQVNLQSGSATFEIPIFQWQDQFSRLSSNIALKYNSGNGLKVDAVSSNIGQGWNLATGGVISRMQAGEPDDQVAFEGNGTPEDISKYPSGYYYDVSSPDGISKTQKQYPIFKGKNKLYKQFNSVAVDKELDQFMFQFNGKSGSFVLGKKINGVHPFFTNENKMKLWFTEDFTMVNQGIRTTISAFYIQDEDGLIYKFSKPELTQVLRAQYCDKNFLNKRTQPNIKSGKVYYQKGFSDPTIYRPYIISSWYLTEVEDPFTHRKITIDYVIRDISNDGSLTITSQKVEDLNSPIGGNYDYAIVSRSNSISKTPVIQDIIFPDGHTVYFNYGANRVDLTGDKVLASVDIKYQTRFQSKWIFNTAYFILNRIGIPVTDQQKGNARLCLRSLKKLGPDLKDEELPHVFEYYVGSGLSDDFVPPPFFHLKDICGFYNGNNSVAYNGSSLIPLDKTIDKLNNSQLKGLCFLRSGGTLQFYNEKSGYAKNGLLKQINFPGGSTLKYVYEQSKAKIDGQYVDWGGVHVSEIQKQTGCEGPVILKYKFVLKNSDTSSLWGVEAPANQSTLQNHYNPESKYWALAFTIVKCKFGYQYPGIQSMDQIISLTTLQQILQIVGEIANVVSTVSSVMNVIKLCHLSPGIGTVIAVVMDVITGIIDFVQTCLLSVYMDKEYTTYYNLDMNSINPLPVQYKRVEVAEHNGANGVTVYEFTSDEDYSIWNPTNEVYSMKQRYGYWAYGLPKRITVYDEAGFSSGTPKVETENIYDFSKAQQIPSCKLCYGSFRSYKAQLLKTSSKRSDVWIANKDLNGYTTDMISDPDMKVDAYYAYYGRTTLSQTIQKVYKSGSASDYVVTKYEFEYHTAYNFEVSRIKTTQPNGDVYYKELKYNSDYSNTVLQSLVANNINNATVSEINTIEKAGSGARVGVGQSATEYTAIANGNVVAYRKLVQYADQPVPLASVQHYDPDGANTTFTEIEKLYYDAIGNVVGASDKGYRKITNIFDYNNQLIVAKIVNVDPVNDKAAYTSFETASLGGWQLAGTSQYNHNLFVTGSTSFVMITGNSFTAPLNTSKKYTLSFWATATPVVTNAILKKSGQSVNGFIYYQYETNTGAAQVVLTGAGNVDELRLYPVEGRMETTTYDPLIGKTSSCDENNRITYYEYDASGRLRFVKDEKMSVLKMMEYNVVSKGCPTVYTNSFISEIFIKNNCGTGYIGSEVVYTIPAGKYTSTISQEAVDAQVDAELAEMGQAYANTNGTCIQVFANDAMSQSFTKDDCADWYKGSAVTYTVPAGTYTSTISKQDANDQAQEDIDANGQVYANQNGTCVVDTDPYFEAEENAPTQCQQSGGVNTGHLLILMTDVNPNSSTYNQTQWGDMGLNTTVCPATQTIYARIETENIIDYPYDQYKDFIVRFYSDAACTIPVSVSDLEVSYKIWYYDNYYLENIYYPHTATCNGTQTVLGTGIHTYHEYFQDYGYWVDYYLTQVIYTIPL